MYVNICKIIVEKNIYLKYWLKMKNWMKLKFLIWNNYECIYYYWYLRCGYVLLI